jgi:hypothetical protein
VVGEFGVWIQTIIDVCREYIVYKNTFYIRTQFYIRTSNREHFLHENTFGFRVRIPFTDLVCFSPRTPRGPL